MPVLMPHSFQRYGGCASIAGGGEEEEAAPPGQSQGFQFHWGSNYPKTTPVEVGTYVSAGLSALTCPTALPASPRILAHTLIPPRNVGFSLTEMGE